MTPSTEPGQSECNACCGTRWRKKEDLYNVVAEVLLDSDVMKMYMGIVMPKIIHVRGNNRDKRPKNQCGDERKAQ